MSTIEHAISLAAIGHEGQVDKAGKPYILHPLRVMLAVDTMEEKIVAVLHDVYEDCSTVISGFVATAGFPDPVYPALLALTRGEENPDETYKEFIGRCGRNPIARVVKLADLRDNADLSRIENPTDRDRKRTAKYHAAIRQLTRLAPL